jgi:hypothetical protein
MSRILTSLVILNLAALPLRAQTGAAIVTGVVKDTSGVPIAGAEVFVGRTDKPVVTNDHGRYRMVGAPTGPRWVAARKIGYSPVRNSVRILKGETQVVDLVMTALPVTLPELKVVEQSGMKRTRLQDFWDRSRASFGGHFLTSEDLERRNPITLAVPVRQYLPWAALESWERNSMDYGPMWNVQPASAGLSHARCAPSISFDGGIPTDTWNVGDIPVGMVEAIEIYKPRWLDIPVEFQMDGRAQRCGLVVLWTK